MFFNSVILSRTNKPLDIVKIKTDPTKDRQVLVKILFSGFCSSQYGEVIGIKGKDHYLPHCVGHEACGRIIEIGPKVKNLNKGDLVVLHWMKNKEKDCSKIFYKTKKNKIIKSGMITTFNEYAKVSSNRVTKVKTKKINLKYLPFLGCSISVAFSTLEKILKIKKNKNILILGSGALGLPMIHYSKIFKLKNIEILDINKIALMKAKKFGATSVFQNYKDKKLTNKLNNDFYDYIIDTTGSSKLINFILKFPIYTKFALCGVPQLNERIKLNSLKINYGYFSNNHSIADSGFDRVFANIIFSTPSIVAKIILLA